MDLINRVGQRKVAKLLFLATIVISLMGYIIRYFLYKEQYMNNMVTMTSIIFKAGLGTILLSSAIGILTIAAHKTKEYRLFSIFTQVAVLFVNNVFFYLMIDLLVLTFVEIILSTLFLIFVKKSEAKKRTDLKKQKNTTSSIDKSE